MFFYTVIFLCVWVVCANYFKVDVVFYSAIWVAVISLIFHLVIVSMLPMFVSFSFFERMQHLTSCALLGFILAISIPTVIDRSLSFYILEKLQQRGGSIQLAKFDYIFTVEYMREHRLVDVRLTEQEKSGTLVVNEGCVILTEKGDKVASFGRFFRQYFLPKRRLLLGEYTDQLIDPFSRSDAQPDYLCDK
jgi:hypothetical protein